MGEEASAIPDEAAQKVWEQRKAKTPIENLTNRAILSAVKLYMAVKRDLDQDPDIIAAGMNCLNESMFSDTTPCLAWNFLYEDQRLVWGCEADLVSMLTKVLIGKTIDVPFMMTNLYPFQMGDAALKHEHIPYFPEVEGAPENYILAAHCGYLGVVPQAFSTEWTLKKKVLAIVDDNANAIDGRLPEGDITLVKLMPPFDRWSVVEGDSAQICTVRELSHCLNGAVIRVPNGKKPGGRPGLTSLHHHHRAQPERTGNGLESVRYGVCHGLSSGRSLNLDGLPEKTGHVHKGHQLITEYVVSRLKFEQKILTN